ncbi:Uncharacterised protein [Klebsiella pneumoniae]|nr:Uncharacterised protein [Klebsiella pneumoniae]
MIFIGLGLFDTNVKTLESFLIIALMLQPHHLPK